MTPRDPWFGLTDKEAREITREIPRKERRASVKRWKRERRNATKFNRKERAA